MSYSTLQKDLERITLKKDLEQALDRMVDFEEEVNRNNEEEDVEDVEEDIEEEEDIKEEDTNNTVQVVGSYLFGVVVGFSLVNICSYINGRGKDNQR